MTVTTPSTLPNNLRREVLDHGIVELLDWMGNDLRVVNAAQASFAKMSPEYRTREGKILGSLMREEHGVPFEHVVLTFRLRLPLFLAAQFKKHRMSSWSEQSGRYDELEPLFYIPAVQDVRQQVGKPMEYRFEPAGFDDATAFLDMLATSYGVAWNTYQLALKRGIAKEQARLCLPVATYTNVVWTMNLRTLFNFLHLRVDSHAQGEAQVYAKAMEDLAIQVAPNAMKLWTMQGRPNP